MKTIQFDNRDGYDITAWSVLSDKLQALPPSLWEVVIRKPVRSQNQNNAIHKYCEMVAEELNNAGHTKQEIIPLIKTSGVWSMESVKEDMWKAFQGFLGLGDKTSKLKTDEVSKVYDLTNLFLAEKVKMHVPFPDRWRLEEENIKQK